MAVVRCTPAARLISCVVQSETARTIGDQSIEQANPHTAQNTQKSMPTELRPMRIFIIPATISPVHIIAFGWNLSPRQPFMS